MFLFYLAGFNLIFIDKEHAANDAKISTI